MDVSYPLNFEQHYKNILDLYNNTSIQFKKICKRRYDYIVSHHLKCDLYLNMNCENCENCIMCSNCKSCSDCMDCNSCINCNNCEMCFECVNCSNRKNFKQIGVYDNMIRTKIKL